MPPCVLRRTTELVNYRTDEPRRSFVKGNRRNVVTRRHGLSYCGNWAPLMCTGRGLLWVTVIRWHRAGFRAYWRWKSRPRSGRPKTPLEIRQLIREISLANPLWGAPRLHGELLKLGIDVGQTTVAKYMARGRRPPSQGWKTFLHNHADGIASMDLFVIPTISFRPLYGLLILHHRSPPNPVAGSDRAPNGGMDFAPAHRGLWLESSTAIHHS